MGRINAWHTAFNLAKDRVTGGGFDTFQGPTFRKYAPEPENVHAAHSIYFQVLGDHGFIGFGFVRAHWSDGVADREQGHPEMQNGSGPEMGSRPRCHDSGEYRWFCYGRSIS